MKRVLLILVFFISYIQAQDFNLTGAGARAEGFGGAFIGLADDATAVTWNPAGLSQLERPEASIVTRFISDGVSSKNNLDPSLNSDERQGHFSVNFGSVALPLKLGNAGVVAAIAFQRQLDFYDNQKFQYEVGTNSIVLDSKLTGGVNTITPGISMRLSPVVAVGAAVNIWTGSLNSDQKLTLSTTSASGFLQNIGNEDFSGLNFVIGGLVDLSSLPNPVPVKFGVSLKTPFTLKGSGSTKDEDNNFSTSGSIIQTSNVSEEVQMPLMLGFGVSYRPNDNLVFAMDYEIRSFGDKQLTSTQTPTSPAGPTIVDPPTPISASKNGLNQFRVGGEYLIIMEKSVIPIRLGFRTVPTVLADMDYNSSSGQYSPSSTQVSGSGISIGSGFIGDTFALDITLSSNVYTQKYSTEGQIDYSTVTISSSVIIYF